MKYLAVFLWCVTAFAAEDWSKSYGTYGCGKWGEGDGYADGIKKAQATAG